jgi:ATP-binding protein involved in chromosome partitioning
MTALTEAVREAAGSVIDPELRRPLAELGMIGEVAVEGDRASIQVKLTIAGCPAAQTIERDVFAAAAAVPGVAEVVVNVAVMTPDERAQMLTALRPEGAKHNPFTADSLTRVIAITSGKGGVGKSSLTANLACALTAQGYRVGILDADVHGYSIPALMGLAPEGIPVRPTRLDDMIVPPVGHDVKVISIGMFVDDQSTAVAWRGPMLQRTISQFLTDVYFGDLDFLLLDLPPGTGDVAITVGQLLPHSDVLIVTTPQPAAAGVAIRAGMLARQTGQRVIGVVENMSALEGPDGTTIDLFGFGGAQAVATGLATDEQPVPVLGQVPLSIGLRVGGDTGVPVVAHDPKDPAARAIIELAGVIATSGRSRAGKPLGLSPR